MGHVATKAGRSSADIELGVNGRRNVGDHARGSSKYNFNDVVRGTCVAKNARVRAINSLCQEAT